MLNCRTFEIRLHDMLDRRRLPAGDKRLCEHAARCPRCQELLASYSRLCDGLTFSPPPALPANFSECVVDRFVASCERDSEKDLRSVIARTRSDEFISSTGRRVSIKPVVAPRFDRRSSRRFWFAVVAASLLFALIPALRWQAGGSNRVARTNRGGESKQRLAIATPGPIASPHDTSERLVDDARDARPSPPISIASLEPWRAILNELSREVQVPSYDSVTALTQGLAPLRNSLTTVLDTLLISFPITRPSNAESTSIRSAVTPVDSGCFHTA